jgi:hypothetical protein
LVRSVLPPWDQGSGWWISHQAKGRWLPSAAQVSWVRLRARHWVSVCRRPIRPRSRVLEQSTADSSSGKAEAARPRLGLDNVAGLLRADHDLWNADDWLLLVQL